MDKQTDGWTDRSGHITIGAASIISFTPGANVIKLFRAVSYDFS
jgi:hypothetical protein